MIGSAKITRPIADGIVSSMTSRIACASAPRNSALLPSAALRETSGSVTVATATPKIPSGNCMRRNAMFSHVIGAIARSRRTAKKRIAVDRDVHLHGARRDGGRTHQGKDFAHTGIAPVEIGPENETDAAEREGSWTRS